jgi:DNA-binding NarL/FixJ family response regulator
VLEDAMQRVAGGGTFVDPLLVAGMVTADASLAILSDREREVLGLMAEGLSDRGIAERLTVSLQTVYTHVQHVFAKLELPATSSDNRRVRAVVAYLTARAE